MKEQIVEILTSRGFFRKKHSDNVITGRGPTQAQILLASAQAQDWLVINKTCLNHPALQSDVKLRARVNAIASALAIYGPTSNNLPSIRNNKGSAEGKVFHGHAISSQGGYYVLEWTVVSAESRIIALLGFDAHENYRFRQKPLNEDIIKTLLDKPETRQRLLSQQTNRSRAAEKLNRICKKSAGMKSNQF